MSQQPPKPGQQDVTGTLIDFLRERQQRGISTYGRSLETFNGRSSVQDALEEALDLAQYIQQVRMELEATLRMLEAFDSIRVNRPFYAEGVIRLAATNIRMMLGKGAQ